jgi:hypothetical protein
MKPITLTARSKAWTAFARSNTGIVGSNPTRGMDVCVRLFCVCVVLYVGSGLATGWYPIHGAVPTVYRIKKLKKRPRSTRAVEPERQKECLIYIPHDLHLFLLTSVHNLCYVGTYWYSCDLSTFDIASKWNEISIICFHLVISLCSCFINKLFCSWEPLIVACIYTGA